ncbi:MAG TPA: hypothetical protein PLV68_18445, partial [Ilumatobacteraceae bacterium]|nr:hypothetical protein [Ilumatobacteraceae bacterium]
EMCNFGHEHGDDPATSDIYDWAMEQLSPSTGDSATGIPFGLASEALITYSNNGVTQANRHEDNVGHKVFVKNDLQLISQSPREWVRLPDGTPVKCDYLIKTHQGSHSADATTNNAHELFYAVRCNDGTELAVTTLSRFGDANQYHRSCAPGQVVTTSGSNLPDGDGGKRLIPDRGCLEQYVLVPPTGFSDLWSFYEVWQSANEITTTGGDVLATYDPWFGVRNPSRYAWSGKDDGVDGLGATVDAAWETDPNDGGKVTADPWLAICTLPPIPKASPESPFDGAQRDLYLRTTIIANDGGASVWYTDPYGANASTTPFPGSIRQVISATADPGYPTLERQNFGLGH